MDFAQILVCFIFLALSAGAFLISYFQFKEKGYLFNNAYFWAAQEERQQMDEHKALKKAHYRQSAFAFLFIGMVCLLFAAYIAAGRIWLLFADVLALISTVVYAVVSSVKSEQR